MKLKSIKSLSFVIAQFYQSFFVNLHQVSQRLLLERNTAERFN
ncbi:hypothetical protein PTUN_a3072 [Pseudoalteromonas tunicata]|nr:hypothetical protein PTUN_a3072 [Pseudoalteromonas tunicata]